MLSGCLRACGQVLSVLPKNTIQMTQPGLEPGPLNPESGMLTTRPPCLPQK